MTGRPPRLSADDHRDALTRKPAGRKAVEGETACTLMLNDGERCGLRTTHRCTLCGDLCCERHSALHHAAKAYRWG